MLYIWVGGRVGQLRWTVNSLSSDYGGSNPSLPTIQINSVTGSTYSRKAYSLGSSHSLSICFTYFIKEVYNMGKDTNEQNLKQNIVCNNKNCSNQENGICKKFTYAHLKNKMRYEEREW